ncbi:conserved hypothetical protein [Ricinus communis]|uniref:Uncharacterized protein n=1 Tax=Ricinus communis TaxID=3988 RepID=B9RL12_RICCO|nr:conserved hypothetical protein [Ricinus communis]
MQQRQNILKRKEKIMDTRMRPERMQIRLVLKHGPPKREPNIVVGGKGREHDSITISAKT